jgi:CheY-like chemotaxis protein
MDNTNSSPSKFFAVMLIDDNEIDNLINHKMVESVGIAEKIYVHTGAKSGIEFLRNIEKLPDLADKILPEVIFLDIDMPLMDGFQFLDLFGKLSESTKKRCKIVMLTSSINPHDISKSKNYDYVVKYMNKPLTNKSLASLEI